jgi:hypothetical protein
MLGDRPLVVLVDDDHLASQATNVISRITLDRQWHHVAISREADHLQLYCDGEPAGETRRNGGSGAITTDLRTLGLDRKAFRDDLSVQQQISLSLQGAIDEFCIHSRALNLNEIRKLAAGELSGWVRDTRLPDTGGAAALPIKTEVAKTPQSPPSAKALSKP